MAKLSRDLGVSRLEQPDERAVLERGADSLYFGEFVTPAEHIQEARGLTASAPECPPLVQDDAPRDHGENSEDREYEL